jgi:hypothetical protein
MFPLRAVGGGVKTLVQSPILIEERSQNGLQGGPFCYPEFQVSVSFAGKFKEE